MPLLKSNTKIPSELAGQLCGRLRKNDLNQNKRRNYVSPA